MTSIEWDYKVGYHNIHFLFQIIKCIKLKYVTVFSKYSKVYEESQFYSPIDLKHEIVYKYTMVKAIYIIDCTKKNH